MAEESLIYDVAPGQFEAQVIQASAERPVVVDFWAEWCAPCRTLTPILEKLVRGYEGRAALAKVDIEQHQEMAAQFGVRAVPTVKVFRAGRVAVEFMGALPEEDVKRALDAVVPTAADALVNEGDHLIAETRVEEAEGKFRKALTLAPDHTAAGLRLASLVLERGEMEQAQELLSRIEENAAEFDAAQGMLARIEFDRTRRDRGGTAACEARVAANADDLDARYDLAGCLAAEGQYDRALQEFLAVLTGDKDYRDGAAKKAMVHIFSLVGPRSELADSYRKKLAGVLY